MAPQDPTLTAPPGGPLDPRPPLPITLEHDDEPLSPYRFWASIDPGELGRETLHGLKEAIHRDAAAREEALRARNVIVVRTDPKPGDRERPIGWPSALSAAEALRALRADLKRWGLPSGPDDARVVRGHGLLDAPDAFLPPDVAEDPGTVTGRAFLAANHGAAVLDALAPGWHEGVDSELVEQGSCDRNVLDLAFGPDQKIEDLLEGFTERHGETHPDDLFLMGFDPADLHADKDQRELAAEVLDLYWRREIGARREGRTPPRSGVHYGATVRITVPFSPALGDPWKPPAARVEEFLEILLADPAVGGFEFLSGLDLLPPQARSAEPAGGRSRARPPGALLGSGPVLSGGRSVGRRRPPSGRARRLPRVRAPAPPTNREESHGNR